VPGFYRILVYIKNAFATVLISAVSLFPENKSPLLRYDIWDLFYFTVHILNEEPLCILVWILFSSIRNRHLKNTILCFSAQSLDLLFPRKRVLSL